MSVNATNNNFFLIGDIIIRKVDSESHVPGGFNNKSFRLLNTRLSQNPEPPWDVCVGVYIYIHGNLLIKYKTRVKFLILCSVTPII